MTNQTQPVDQENTDIDLFTPITEKDNPQPIPYHWARYKTEGSIRSEEQYENHHQPFEDYNGSKNNT